MDSISLTSRNPRAITAAAADSLLLCWIADEEVGDDQPSPTPREVLNLWTPSLEVPVPVAQAEAGLGAPALAWSHTHAVIACPTSDDGLRFALRLFEVRQGEATSTVEVDVGESTAPGHVAICPSDDGFILCWERWARESVELVVAEVAEDLKVSPSKRFRPPTGLARSPRLAWDGERAWIAWLGSRGAGAPWIVYLAPLDAAQRPLELIAERGFGVGGLDLAASGPGRIWVAWHTDRRPSRPPDLTRWIEVRSVVGHRIVAHRGRPLWRRWGALGEDQGLEYPVLAPQSGGRLSLIARSSHRHWRLDLCARGWSDPSPIDEPGWECRSRRPGVIVSERDGALLVARRKRHQVVVDRLDLSEKRGVARPRPIRPLRAARARAPRQPATATRRRGLLLAFGDIHQHTAHSDGTGSLREAYERARDEYRDAIVSVTDHESFLGKRIGPGEWRRIMAECDLHDEPGRFVTLPGYEWTGSRHPGPGHKCVYWPRSDLPLLGREHALARTSADLIRAVGEMGGLVFPHHVGWTGADADAHDERVQTCWEIVSSHGVYEAMGVGPIGQRDTPLEGHFLRDQLDAGLAFGFVGGSDGHGLLWHHGIAHRRDSHRTGITAVWLQELTRRGLFDALRARRCYATTGARIVVDLHVDGAAMGAALPRSSSLQVDAFAEGTAQLRKAEIIRAHGVVTPLPVNGSSLRSKLNVPAASPGSVDYLYLRVEQVDDEVAWSSPLWVTT